MSRLGSTLERLAELIDSRHGGDIERSWSAKLLADPTLASKKLAEEALEAALAAERSDRSELIAESADLLYHWLVVLAAAGVTLDEIAAALEARRGRSGIEEKSSRNAG